MPARRTQPKKKMKMQLEIAYDFHPTDRHYRRHWMYYEATGSSQEDCRDDAKKYYEKQIRALGWGKFTTLKEIKPLGKTNDPPNYKNNSDLSSSRDDSRIDNNSSSSRKSNRGNSKDSKKTDTGTSTPAASSRQPKTDRKTTRKTSPTRKKKT